jgi:hypothetical protein
MQKGLLDAKVGKSANGYLVGVIERGWHGPEYVNRLTNTACREKGAQQMNGTRRRCQRNIEPVSV